MSSYSLQNGPLNFRAQPQTQSWAPTICDQNSLFFCLDIYCLLPGSLSPWPDHLLGYHLLHLASLPGLPPLAFQDCFLLLPTSFSLNNKPTSLAGLSPISWNEFQFQSPLSHWWACPVFNKQTNPSLYHRALTLMLDCSMPYKIFQFNNSQA